MVSKFYLSASSESFLTAFEPLFLSSVALEASFGYSVVLEASSVSSEALEASFGSSVVTLDIACLS